MEHTTYETAFNTVVLLTFFCFVFAIAAAVADWLEHYFRSKH